MKLKATLRVIMLFLVLLTSVVSAKAQAPTYQLQISNETLVNPLTYQFDIYLIRTGGGPFELANFGCGIGFNTAVVNGGTVSFTVVPGFSDLNSAQQPTATTLGTAAQTSVTGGVTYRYMNVTPKVNPGAGAGSIISSTGTCPAPGTRIGRFQLANTVAFTGNTRMFHIWSTAPGSGKSNTVVSAYVGTTATPISNAASFLNWNSAGTCLTNMILNPVAAVCTGAGTTTAVSCFGGTNGTATITLSGADAFSSGTYTVDGGAAIPYTTNPFTITGLSAGNHTIIADNAGANPCTTAPFVVNVGSPTAVAAVPSAQVNVACFGGATGSVTISGSGGTPPYTGTGTFTGLSAGTYNYTVTDFNGCPSPVLTVTITQPTAALSAVPSGQVNVACFGGSTGSVTISGAGGTAPYTGTGTFTGLAAGTYNYPISDFNGCTASVSVTIGQPSTAVSASESHTPAVCNGTSNVTISGSGGTPPYTGTGSFIQPANTTQVYNIADANGCPASVSVTTTVAGGASAAITAQTNVLCFGQSTGSATVTATGGTPPYTYSWSPSGGTGSTASGLAAGTYTVTVTDANITSCPATATVTITGPASALSGGSTGQVNVLCFGQSTGSVTITASGGTAPYTGTGTFTGLAAGNYSYPVSDFNGCTTTVNVTITGPASALSAVQSGLTQPVCNGGTGSVTISGTGGTAPYSGTGTFTGLAAGTYNYTVTDFNGCTAGTTVTIINPPAVTAPTATVTPATCTSLATITVNAPNPALTYSIDGTTYIASGIFTGVTGGTYLLTARNAAMCVSPATSVPVAAQPATPPTPILTATPTGVGTYTLTATNFIPGAIILWSTGATTPSIIGDPLVATTYSVTQSNGTCTSAAGSITLANITADPAIGGMQISSMTDVPQNTNTLLFPPTYKLKLPVYNLSQSEALPNGTTTITIDLGTRLQLDPGFVLGTAPLSSYFAWSMTTVAGHQIITGNQIALVPADFAGIAVFTVRGTLSCTSVVDANITATLTDEDMFNNDALLQYTFPPTVSAVPVNVTCFGLANGSITVTSSPGTTITILNAASVPVPNSNLAPGVYTVIASATGDAPTSNICATSTTVTITQPTVLNATTSVTNVNCYGGATGTATALPTGGTPSYSYLWSPGGQTTQTAVGLAAGNYSCTITDAKGCTKVVNVTIAQPGAPITLVMSGTQVSCFGNSNGTATVTASGGTPGSPIAYTYSWNTVPTQVGQTATNLVAGIYTVTVTDSKGCTAFASYTVTQPNVLSAPITGTNVTCFGSSNGTATVGPVSGGTPPYTYAWSTTPVQTGVTATGLAAGTYVCVITDANGCTTSVSYTVTSPTAIVLAPTHTNVSCFGGLTGTITANASGGTPAYSYSIGGPSQPSGTFTGLGAGTYTLTVTDASGCVKTASVVINGPLSGVSVTTSASSILCYGNATGTATAVPTGGTAPYTYVWNTIPVQNTQTATGLAAGTYTVTVTDALGCSVTQTQSVGQPGSALALGIAGTPVACYNAATGTVSASGSGGSGPYSYVIAGPTVNTTGAATGAFTGLTAGLYTVTCTDANGCTKTAFFTVSQPAAPLTAALTGLTGNACHFGNVGTMSVGAVGGTPGYSFTINAVPANTTGAVTGLFTGLAGGVYTVTSTDANGCTSTVTATVSAPAGLVPDLSLGSNYTSNFFVINGVENRIVFNVAEIGGNPAVGDTIRITKVSGYDFFFDNTSTSQVVGSINYILNNTQWKIDNSNPAFLSMIKVDQTNPLNPGTINCSTIEFVSLRMVRNTPNISTFTLSSRIRRCNGETNLGNNLNSIVFTAE